MKMLSTVRVITIVLLTTLFFSNKTTAQPFFADPTTCIPADPEQGNTIYKLVSNGYQINSISALGDLEIISIDQSLPTTNNITVTVRSENIGRSYLNDCAGYLSRREAANFGFGKGLIRVLYGREKCIGILDQPIFKIFKETPPITGIPCVAVGDIVTYSVCPILTVNLDHNIGMDHYFWGGDGKLGAFPPGLEELYRSADESSITFRVVDPWSGGKIFCRFGQCNTGFSVFEIGVKTFAPETVLINGMPVSNGQSICLPSSANTISLVANGMAGTGYSYNWQSNNNTWKFMPGYAASALSISGNAVNLNINESRGIIYLTSMGSCNSRVDSFIINRTLTAPLVIKKIDTINCPLPGSSISFTVNNNNYTAYTQNLTYAWTIPAGWSVTGNPTGSTITAITGVTGGVITASSTGCAGTALSLSVNVKPPAPGPVNGNNCILPGSLLPLTYSVSPVPGATGYVWTNTALGWSGISNTNSITYIPSGTSVGTINVVALSGSCISDPVQMVINFSQTSVTGIGNNCVASGVACTVDFTATGGTGSPIVWDIPSALGTITNNSGTTISVNTFGDPGVYVVSATTTGCSTSSGTFTKTIIVGEPDTLIYMHGISPAYDIISVSPVSGCVPTAYCWRLNNTGACVGTGQSILLQNGGPASYTVQVSYGTCSRYLTHSSQYSSRAVTNIERQNALFNNKITIVPNPATTSIILQLPGSSGIFSVGIYNSKGNLIKKKNCNAGSNYFNTGSWPNGAYIIKITNSKGAETIKKIVISK